ncbi:MAG: exodeoxyribonuclease VII small subunit [Planctomycetota bacterium]
MLGSKGRRIRLESKLPLSCHRSLLLARLALVRKEVWYEKKFCWSGFVGQLECERSEFSMNAKKVPGYRDATREIDEILRRIDDADQIDVDALADDVERAAQLLEICGDKLKAAEVRVREVSERLVEDDDDSNEIDVEDIDEQ